MSAVSSKPLTLARIEDLTLGAFANLQPSQTLDHLVRFLSTWSGSELSRRRFLCGRVAEALVEQQVVHGQYSRALCEAPVLTHLV